VFVLYFSIVILVVCAYCYLIIYILNQWAAIESIPDNTKDGDPSLSGVSIIIPARNEAENIISCLKSILSNDAVENIKPQIIVVDDHSIDNTAQLVIDVESPYVQLLSLNIDGNNSNPINAYKKAAISLGLSQCKYDYVIQFDADTIVPKEYLKTIIKYKNENKAEFLAAPIKCYPCDNLLHHFQQLDILGMMAVTGAGIQSSKWYMANGANMSYRKNNVQFSPQDLASGDDVYTIQKVAEEKPESILYIKDAKAVVTTAPVNSYGDLYQQRIRWATKNKMMPNLMMQMMMGIPFINALMMIAHIPMMIVFGIPAILLFSFHLMIKLMIDYIFLKEITTHFDAHESMRYFLPANLMHIVYIACIGALSFFIKDYKWKGRTVH